MTLLDGGIRAVFGAAFGAFYLPGQLVTAQTEPVYGPDGEITGYSGADPVPCKVQIDAVTYAMQQADGYADGDVRIIVLAAGLAAPITIDHRIIARGQEWLVASVEQDAAASHWVCRGRAA